MNGPNAISLSQVKTFPASPPPASCMQWEVLLNKPPRFTQLLEISFKGSELAAERVDGPQLGAQSGPPPALQPGCSLLMTWNGVTIYAGSSVAGIGDVNATQ